MAHDIARYVDAHINLETYEWGAVSQDEPIVRGDCNVLRITLDGEPPENALIYVRFINLLTHDSYGEISETLTDGMEIDIPQNKELYSSPGQIGAAFSIETETCKESCPHPARISIAPLCCGKEYVGETGVALISDVYAAGQAAQQAEQELRQAAADGEFDGQDGFSPVITITDIQGGHRVTITDAQGTQYFDVMNGEGGGSGGGGDGFSPTITVVNITGGHRLIITDVDGTKTVDVMDGVDGNDGAAGQDGFSPTAAVMKSGNTATITITDKSGTTTAQISDGTNGTNGTDGTDGVDGTNAYVHIKYADSDTLSPYDQMYDTPQYHDYIGIYSGDSATAPPYPGAYTWARYVGADGTNGTNGYTPVKGTDYWTAADKADIVSDVLAALPTWTGGSY